MAAHRPAVFIAEITARAFIVADSNKRRTLSRSDIAKALSKSDQFDFLIDIVPREEAAVGAPTTGGPGGSGGVGPSKSLKMPVNVMAKRDGGDSEVMEQVFRFSASLTVAHVPSSRRCYKDNLATCCKQRQISTMTTACSSFVHLCFFSVMATTSAPSSLSTAFPSPSSSFVPPPVADFRASEPPSSRPAPPSPSVSRRVSKAFSVSSEPSRSLSRSGSTKKKSARKSTIVVDLESSLDAETRTPIAVESSFPRIYIKIRDFAFQRDDERFLGMGSEVPKPNRLGRMNRKLGPRPASGISVTSSEGGDEDDDDEDDDGWGWKGGWSMSAGWASRPPMQQVGGPNAADILDRDAHLARPSQSDLDRNFLGDEEEEDEEDEYFDASSREFDDEQSQEPLYPGLYRALYSFEPEGAAEMKLVEEQVVRVIGRGQGGVGWAVVVDDDKGTHALVPESYLEPVQLD